MGFACNYKLDNGVTVTHGDILKVVFDAQESTAEISMGVWVTKESYEAKDRPVAKYNFIVPTGENPELASQAFGFLYQVAVANLPDLISPPKTEE